MDRSIVVALISLLGLGSLMAVTIDSPDFRAVPVGEAITLTGSGFSGTTKASFLWAGDEVDAVFREISDTKLEVDYAASQDTRDHRLLVETVGGSILTNHLDAEDIGEFSTTGVFPPSPSQIFRMVIVKSGAVLEGLTDGAELIDMIYVEAGGALNGWGGIRDILIVAESGALLDFRNGDSDTGNGTYVYYSTGTQILGDIPVRGAGVPYARELTTISLSQGVGPFTEGYELDVLIEGDGSVTRNKPGPYYESGTAVQLTATPGPNQFFSGWSTGASSTTTTITMNRLTSQITAMFSPGKTLTIYSGLGGQIIRSPDLEFYGVGQSVTLTPQALPGYEFLGWGGIHLGETGTLEISISDDTEVLGIFRRVDQDDLIRITGADHYFVPPGETITVSGSGMMNITGVEFIDRGGSNRPASFQEESESTLEIVSPLDDRSSQDYRLLVESENGSTLTTGVEEEDRTFFNGVGLLQGFNDEIVVEPGAILEGFEFPDAPLLIDVIYVKAGGVYKVGWEIIDLLILAEDGAILDFTSLADADVRESSLYYSPGTQIIGGLPTNKDGQAMGQELAPISYSPGIGFFTTGAELDLTILGNGVVGRSVPGPYYPQRSLVQLTAQPGPGESFVGWSGVVNSTEPTISLLVPSDPITATFTVGYALSTYSGLGGQITRVPDKEVYSSEEMVTLTPQAEPGFEFLGWGGDVSGSDHPLEITITETTDVVGIFRRLDQDRLPKILSADYEAVPVGETITLTGTDFAGAARASFIGSAEATEVPFRELSNSLLEVDFLPDRPRRNSFLLVESAGGTMVTSGLEEAEMASFEGVGDYPGTSKWVRVKAGAILEGLSVLDAPFFIDAIYVEAGGVLKVQSFINDVYVFAEDGAVLDFRELNSPQASSPRVFYSPKTEIIGSASRARQVTPISLSARVGDFTQAFRVIINVEGPGSVSGLANPDQYFSGGESLNLAAVANPGNFFIRWSGSSFTTNPTLNLVVDRNLELTAKFSPVAGFVSNWRLQYFSAAQLADPAISGLQADPDQDGNDNTTEYVFGRNPLRPDGGIEISIAQANVSGKTVIFSYLRPRLASDVEYSYLGSSDLTVWNDVTEVGTVDEVSVEEVGERLEKVTVQVVFTDDFPEEYSFRVSAELL